MGQTLTLPSTIQNLTGSSSDTSSRRIDSSERHQRLSEDEDDQQEFIRDAQQEQRRLRQQQQHHAEDSFHLNDLESGMVTSPSTQSHQQQQQQQHVNIVQPTNLLLFGGAPMMIDGLLNYEFFNGINNVNELVSLFGYYGRIEGLFGRNVDHYEQQQQHQEHTPFEFKDTMILRNDVNIQKNSLSLISHSQNGFNLSFKFDVRSNFIDECKVNIYLKAKEIRSNQSVKYESSIALPSKVFNHFVEYPKNDHTAQYYTPSNTFEGTRVDLSSLSSRTISESHESTLSRRDYHDSTSLEYNIHHTISLDTIFTNRQEMQYPLLVAVSGHQSEDTDESSILERTDSTTTSTLIPLVIEIQSETCSQFSLCSLDYQQRSSSLESPLDSVVHYSIKVHKQKLFIGNEWYEVAEIYHQTTNHSNTNTTNTTHNNNNNTTTTTTTTNTTTPSVADTSSHPQVHEEDDDDHLCVICISERASIVVLPCGHLSLCSECANALRNQTNKCPICRQTVESAIKLPSIENM
ncbi:hypothetical protein FDP41_005801 [Naegleria fowleri]|uniref:RING-type domain-containing protein n=1 Tax=Naegleria fowleri TaxID=5763 RepID=A0A6A5BLK7_NAEFO|nr:uncharacterized protein FDP41_005801 [Naegleria fowleri]KAF0975048.1 hypothetical protein FDP41_005801 [Naegleria fowleri]